MVAEKSVGAVGSKKSKELYPELKLCTCSRSVLYYNECKILGRRNPKPVQLFENNQGFINLAQTEKINSKTIKHMDMGHHLIRNMEENGLVDLKYCPTDKMFANTLIKPLSQEKFESLHKMILWTVYTRPQEKVFKKATLKGTGRRQFDTIVRIAPSFLINVILCLCPDSYS